MSLLLLLWGLLSLSPTQASHVAGAALGVSGERLEAICRRESWCRPVRLHERDAWVGPVAYERAVERDWLPGWCPLHWDADPRRYATRGSWGEIAAYALKGHCLPPEVLDVPLLGALFAAKRLRRVEQGRALPAGERWAGVHSSHEQADTEAPQPTKAADGPAAVSARPEGAAASPAENRTDRQRALKAAAVAAPVRCVPRGAGDERRRKWLRYADRHAGRQL